uniref:Protein aurora borealis n=3 Tax=Clastoptera arizonana TaxID=38151 RepID=A0A1B6EC64_9HEMI
MENIKNCDTPNRKYEQNILKTLINPRSTFQIVSRYKCDGEKSSSSNYNNTVSNVPQFKTPPSAIKKIRPFNPFNVGLHERLESTTVSPNVFSSVVSPSQDSEVMKWTIEDLSSIKPAPIDENIEPSSEPDDPKIQEAIERYFSETHLVSSPFETSKKWATPSLGDEHILSKLADNAVASTPHNDLVKIIHTNDVQVQTTLSLPPILPEQVEVVLRPFFNIEEDQPEEFNLSNSSMRRKLFFHGEDVEISPVKSSSENSFQFTSDQKRQFTPISVNKNLMQLDVSPILMEISPNNSSKTRTKLKFLDTDKSINNEELLKIQTIVDDKVCNESVEESNLPVGESEFDMLNPHKTKKRKTSSDEVIIPISIKMAKENNAVTYTDDLGYFTNEDMSWQHSS